MPATARFGDNPIKDPLAGNEKLVGTDPTTGDDFCTTPEILTQYAQENMALAGDGSPGLMSAAQADKLDALYTKDELDAIFAQLGQFPFPIFIGTVVDGFIEVYRHVLLEPVVFDYFYFGMSSGSSLVSVKINGTNVTGWTGIPLNSSGGTATATAAKTMNAGDVLGLEFSSSSGPPTNLRMTLKGNVTL
jgi:hypothetical protein